MKVLLAHPGTQHAPVAAMQLQRKNLLFEFWTCLAIPETGRLARLSKWFPSRLKQALANRIVSLEPATLRTVPLLELQALRRLHSGQDSERVMFDRNRKFQTAISARSIVNADVVVGFDTSSWLLIGRSKRADKLFVLDQSTPHPEAGRNAWLKALHDFPRWSAGVPESLDYVIDNQKLEQAEANIIVAASNFARDSLIRGGIPADRVRVNPYGVDLQSFRPNHTTNSRPFRFVYVGAATARKGFPLLIEAWKKLAPNDAELWLIGDIANVRHLIPDLPGLQILGRISRKKLPYLLASCDVFLFPSYFEGFGLVLLEAMAAGLPPLTTTTTAGPDIITEGENGYIIPPGDLDALIAKMKLCLESPGRTAEMGRNARLTSEKFSWEAYGDRWEDILKTVA